MGLELADSSVRTPACKHSLVPAGSATPTEICSRRAGHRRESTRILVNSASWSAD
jgi:hypothetical protein